MKTLKGTVAIEKNDNRLRLRWSCESKRYCLSLGFSYTDVNLKVAEQKARQIELDILSGNFDPTLNKYRIKQVAVIASPEVVKPSQELYQLERFVPTTLELGATLKKPILWLVMLFGMKRLSVYLLGSGMIL